MGILVQYTGRKAIHTSGVDVGPDFIHLDLNGPAVELPDEVANGLCDSQPQAFKKVQPVSEAPEKAEKSSVKGDK